MLNYVIKGFIVLLYLSTSLYVIPVSQTLDDYN